LSSKAEGKTQVLKPGGYAYLPQGAPHTVRARGNRARAVIEKPYELQAGAAAPKIVIGDEATM
jgi:(S)-ureidoglycine aminohydrolase